MGTECDNLAECNAILFRKNKNKKNKKNNKQKNKPNCMLLECPLPMPEAIGNNKKLKGYYKLADVVDGGDVAGSLGSGNAANTNNENETGETGETGETSSSEKETVEYLMSFLNIMSFVRKAARIFGVLI